MRKHVKLGSINSAFEADGEEQSKSKRKKLKKRSQSQESIISMDWDIFKETPIDNFTHKNPILENLCKVLLKTLTSVFLSVFVLGTALLSRLTLLEITQQLRLFNISFSFTYEQNKGDKHSHLKCVTDNRTVSKGHATNYSSNLGNRNSAYRPPVLQVYWIWALFLVICFPYLIEMLRSLWKIIFKKTSSISTFILLCNIVIETLHSLGLLMLIFIVLTSIDPIRSSMLIYGVGLIPCALDVLPARDNDLADDDKTTVCFRRCWKIIIFVVTLLIATLLISFHASLKNDYFFFSNGEDNQNLYYIVPISLLLISVKYWSLFSERICSSKFLERMNKQTTKISLLVSILKIGYTLLFIYIFYGIGTKDCSRVLFVHGSSNNATNCGLHKVTLSFSDSNPDPFIYASVNMIAGFLCFRSAKTACQLLLQRISFSLPLVLIGPFSTFLVLLFTSQGLSFLKMTPKDAPPIIERDLNGFLSCYYKEFTWERIFTIGFYLSFLFVTRHVWTPKVERLAKTYKLFTSSSYCGALLDQSILLSRRRDEIKTKSSIEYGEGVTGTVHKPNNTLIYACATMWHENENEMIQLLKSIFRMDLDQVTRMYMEKKMKLHVDSYEFQAHIFFDDAFKYDLSRNCFVLNNYVKLLLKCIPRACKAIHTDIGIELPTKIVTPYGGRFEWDLPGTNKMVVHLKNKHLIRHKKRWSQVMYMYYFLGYQIFAQQSTNDSKEIKSENTFLLALDGDVDFEPSAVILLVDRMKRNPKVGAACGRIHPIGTGPMVWYQKFEYAISHWLQKATEHTIGCVLCSPGCFSLFRGSALCADNVLKRYTTLPSEAKHHVQYDQGEDRWLCTLLLQQGFRVEYCAASDALTYCPETFNEFFKQRRRWAPSTMANIMDLLTDWRNVRQKNDSISTLYIFYQLCLMITSIVTPGTIFMLVVGALHSAYDISLTNSLIINLVPVVLMLLLCFVAKEDVQLQFASVISLLYAMLMMLVMVGLMKEIGTYLFCSVTTILFCFVTGTFLLAAICHPNEFFCIMHGLLYFLLIPSMSIFLIFYALGNLQNVSWGTRDTEAELVAKAKNEEMADVKMASKTPNEKKQSTIDRVQNFFMSRESSKKSEMESEYSFSCGNIFRCLCFPKEKSRDKDDLLEPLLNRFDEIVKMRSLEFAKSMKTHENVIEGKKEEAEAPDQNGATKKDAEKPETKKKSENVSSSQDKSIVHNTEWVNEEDLKKMETAQINSAEIMFWESLIKQYLFPLDIDGDREIQMKKKLVVLRNNVCLFFSLINALFVMVVFTIEFSLSNSSATSFNLVCDKSDDVNTKDTNAITIVFLLVFGVTLFVQLMAMLFHRYETFLHILASIDITPKVMSQTQIDNLLRTLSNNNCIQPETKNIGSKQKNKIHEDVKSMHPQSDSIPKKMKKPKNLHEKLDNNFLLNYDDVHKNTDATKKAFQMTSAQMSWMCLLKDPNLQKHASQHREEIRNKWRKYITKLHNPKMMAVVDKLTEKKSGQLSKIDNSLTTTSSSLLKSSVTLSLIDLQDDPESSDKIVEHDNQMTVSATVHSDQSATLESDKQEENDVDDLDSGDTLQRDHKSDQNGSEVIVVQEKENKTASDIPVSFNGANQKTDSQDNKLTSSPVDKSVSLKEICMQDNVSVSSALSIEECRVEVEEACTEL